MINGFQSPNELLQAGIFGLGQNKSLNQWTGRDDLSYQLIWQLEGFGIGNLARIKKQRGDQSRAVIDLFRAQDRVAGEVTRAHAELQSAAARVTQAERSLHESVIAFNGNLEGLQHTTRFGDVLMLVTRPQEAVYALQLMKLSIDEYFTTVAEYNRAGFRPVPRAGLPGAGGRGPAHAWRGRPRRHGAARLSAPASAMGRRRPRAERRRPRRRASH